ncbi:DNA-binding transcriptional LysR family regulator [Altererythrobacter atlanticus]|uniref:LysR family transcriptional regulator n=1 Tax=Croceibacterium atlanticum TaxID=1267766 RepID=UPI0017B29EAE|nr:LysR family transcriptional regulator [Croceibacterium atlanticum]MBB5732843.1 DNA-binding transcriptional LysR family regulator [Croceibacterium atlanticum]
MNLLVAFDVLMEERSVTAAARRLNVTQSAMSAALSRLRHSFQDELLVLHGKRMIPTQHALTLAPEVSGAITRLRGLIASGTAFDPATSRRTFRIDASDYVTTVLLAPLIVLLQKEAPGIGLELSLPGDESRERLDNGEIDLILTPREFMDDVHPRELLFVERHVVAGWAGNPRLRDLDYSVFLESGHVAVRISQQDTYIEAVLSKIAPGRRIEIVAQSFIQVPWLIHGTERLAVMHERLALAFRDLHSLRICDPPFELPLMREMMQYHSTRENDSGLAWLRRRLKEFAKGR